MRTLKNPVEVRGYAMFDKFKVRGILQYDEQAKIARIVISYGHIDPKDRKTFVPSPFKEHNKVMSLVGADFEALNRQIGSKDRGTMLEVLAERIYKILQEKYDWFLES